MIKISTCYYSGFGDSPSVAVVYLEGDHGNVHKVKREYKLPLDPYTLSAKEPPVVGRELIDLEDRWVAKEVIPQAQDSAGLFGPDNRQFA